MSGYAQVIRTKLSKINMSINASVNNLVNDSCAAPDGKNSACGASHPCRLFTGIVLNRPSSDLDWIGATDDTDFLHQLLDELTTPTVGK
jgi:hypothetical protein